MSEWDALTVDLNHLTPMMQHYVTLKRQYPQALLLYRMGDFYETFFQDAHILAQALELTLTGREAGSLGRVPMAGIPHHALERYAAQLVAKGLSLAVCEQMEPADQAKGLVRREVTRLITPGTVLEEGLLPPRQNNYLVAIVLSKLTWGLAYGDISTGELATTQGEGMELLVQELLRLQPAEILWPAAAPSSLTQGSPIPAELPGQFCYTLCGQDSFELTAARQEICLAFGVKSLEGFGCQHLPLAVRAVGGLLHYLRETQKGMPIPFDGLRTYHLSQFLYLDPQTRRNLELTQTVREGLLTGSLLWALDRTRTAMGGRMLRRWLVQPLLDPEAIRARQGLIGEFVGQARLRQQVQGILKEIYDLERLATRVGAGTATARDLVSLGHALARLPQLGEVLADCASPVCQRLSQPNPQLQQLSREILATLVDNPPLVISEGGLIRDGVDAEVDRLRQQIQEDQNWITHLEKTERERTGISTLKVGFTKAFGYYIAISRAKSQQVPSHYIRKQTLVNEERYITPELKERETRILHAQTDLYQQEYDCFVRLRQRVGSQARLMRQVAGWVAEVDVLAGLAEVAAQYQYCCPEITTDRRLLIEEGRHPVLEQLLPAGLFVPNSVQLGLPGSPDLMILTGANMTGKSTFLRQVGLIQVMAQMGSYVPATRASVGICDRIFTRVGAVDDLATGQSTFMVEMNETANILNHATPRSLVLLDEIGRGTATFDGLAIAWAVAEYLAVSLGSRCIFATHYHELNELANLLPNVANFQVAVKELEQEIVFLHKVVPGGASRSYGIEVGRMAGLPPVVIERARQVLTQIENHSHIAVGLRQRFSDPKPRPRRSSPPADQLPLFSHE
ncbi:MAG: DNA mismatch repair protein MutS [Thermostichales cyanobacterium SZTDM-1c_bins_54]